VADTWGRRPASDELHHCWQATGARQVKRLKDLKLENSRLRAERRDGLYDGTNVRLRTPLERTQGPLLGSGSTRMSSTSCAACQKNK
jgi:hypothetical protein